MAKPWAQVAADPQFQALPADQQEAARNQYFQQVVQPYVPPEQLDNVRAQLDQQTGKPAVFDFTSPDGKKFTVTGPPGATSGQAFQILQQQLANGSAPTAGTQAVGLSNGRMSIQPVGDPLSGMSGSDKFDAGVGKALYDSWQGVKQLAMKVGNQMRLTSDQSVAQNQAAIDARRETDAPLMATTAGKAGVLAGDVAQAAVAPEGLAGAVAGGAVLGGIQPTSGDESHLTNAALGAAGGVAGDLGGRVLGRVVQPIRNTLDQTRQAAVDLLRNAGVPLDLAQATGSKVALTLKNAGADSPLLGASKFPGVQQQAFNNAVLKTIGSGGTKATPQILAAADNRIGAVFDNIAARNPVTVDQLLLNDMAGFHAGAGLELSAADAAPIRAQLDNIIDIAARNNGQLSGSAYQNIRSSLNRMSMGGNQQVGYFARDIRSSLDDALQRQASPQDLNALTTARQQYRALQQIAKGTDAADDVIPNALYNAVDTVRNAHQSVYGRGDQSLVQLAQAGKLVLGGKTPNSGTLQRTLGYAATAAGADAIFRVARGQVIDKDELATAAIAGGFAPLAARNLVESQGGKAWLQRWASSKLAFHTARVAQQVGRQFGMGAGAQAGQQTQPPAATGSSPPPSDAVAGLQSPASDAATAGNYGAGALSP
jgi:hypothetical protein